MEKPIIISVHDITNNKMLGYISNFNAYGMLRIDVDIKDAIIFKNKKIAEERFPDNMETQIGRGGCL